MRAAAKSSHLAHQFLAIEGIDGFLICDSEKDSRRAIGRGEWLLFLYRSVAGKRLERGRNQPEWIEREFEFRPRRPGFDFIVKTMQAFLNFCWIEKAHCFIECLRLQIEQKWKGDAVQIADALRRFHGRTGQDACAPWLFAQSFSENGRKFFQLVHVLRQANERERQLTGLREVAIVNFQTFD